MNDVCIDLNDDVISLGYFLDLKIQGVTLSSFPSDEYNIYLCKMDSVGDLKWLKHIGKDSDCRGNSVISDSQNDLILTGNFTNKITICDTTFSDDNTGEFIAKFDQDGDCLWVNYVDNVNWSCPLPIAADEDDNMYLFTTGHTVVNDFSNDGKTVITKFNSSGEIEWMKSTSIKIKEMYLGMNNNTVIVNSDRIVFGGYYVDTIVFAGQTYTSQIEFLIDPATGDTIYYSSQEAMLGIMDTSGNEIAAINITGIGKFTLEAVTTNSTQDIFLQGRYSSDTIFFNNEYITGGSGYLLKYTDEFNLIEARNIQKFIPYGVVSTDNYTIYSSQNWDYMYLMVYDMNCTFIDSIILGDNNVGFEYPRSLAASKNNNIVLAGSYKDELKIDNFVAWGDPFAGYKMFVTKFKDLTTDITKQRTTFNIGTYPNPFTNSTTIEYSLSSPISVNLAIFNSFGEMVYLKQECQQPGKQQIRWDAEGLPPGVYFYSLESGEQQANGKLLLIK